MVRLFKDSFGRGPRRARTAWAGPDVLVIMLEDTLTPAERTMAELGEHERLRRLRMVLQQAMLPDVRTMVERATGRSVQSYVTGIDSEVDGLAVTTLILGPADGHGALPPG